MELRASVLAAVRGIAGAALITVAGCATTPSAEVARTPDHVDPPEPETDAAQPLRISACGRG